MFKRNKEYSTKKLNDDILEDTELNIISKKD